MQLKIFTILCFIGLSFGMFGQNMTITSVTFEGLTKTKPEFLEQLIECKSGMVADSILIQKDEQTLKNLNLFFSVDYQLVFNSTNTGYDLTFIIKEAQYIYPILSAEGFKTQLKIQAGANNINWRGRNQTIGFLYQYYDRHSFSLYQKTPRHKNSKTGHEVSIAKYSTVEPLYFSDTTSNFNFDNYSLDLAGKYWFTNKLNLDLGGMLMYEKYFQRDDAVDLPGKGFTFFKYQLKTSLTYNAVNSHFEFFDGVFLKLYGETIQTKDYPMASFFKLKSTIKYFKNINNSGNIAIHHSFGIATNNDSPFSPFVLDGFLNIRGIGNRVSRGTAENILNIEYRQSVLDKKYFTIQLVSFSDIGSLRQPGANLESLFNKSEMNYFAGLGVRLHSKFFYKAIFRLDYAINLQDANHRGFSFGLGHFF